MYILLRGVPILRVYFYQHGLLVVVLLLGPMRIAVVHVEINSVNHGVGYPVAPKCILLRERQLYIAVCMVHQVKANHLRYTLWLDRLDYVRPYSYY